MCWNPTSWALLPPGASMRLITTSPDPFLCPSRHLSPPPPAQPVLGPRRQRGKAQVGK